MKSTLKRLMPNIWNSLVLVRKLPRLALRSFGTHGRECPICGYTGRFLAEIHFPDIFTFDAICPKCGSLPRNRLLVLKIGTTISIPQHAKLLHFAPEQPVRSVLREMVAYYKTADLYADGVDLRINIENIEQPDDEWDYIVCSHVLEHVDHRTALAELYRILAPGGSLLILIPVVEGWRSHYENEGINSPYERGIHFGKTNHLRRLGSNIREDIQNAGFDLTCLTGTGEETVRFGLIPGEVLFVCTKYCRQGSKGMATQGREGSLFGVG